MIYLPAFRDARALEARGDYSAAANTWREAAAQCPPDTRERQYCEAQAAACARIAANAAARAAAE